MSLIPLPAGYRVNSFSLRLPATVAGFAAPFGGSEQAVDLLNDRWIASLSLTPSTRADSGAIEAFIAAQRGGANHTELYHFARPVPQGTLGRVHAVHGLVADAPQGAASVQVATAPGATLKAGDMLGLGGLLLMCAADCVADAQGLITVPIVNRLRKAITGLRRASTATYIDAAGVLQTAAINVPRYQGGQLLVEAAGSNLMPNSEAFDDAAWVKQSTTVAPGLWDAGPNGVQFVADAVSEVAAVAQHDVYSVSTASGHSFSVFVKPAGVRYVALYGYAGGIVCGRTFDLVGAAPGAAWGAGTPTATIMQPLANGWFRIGIESAVPFNIGAVCLCHADVVGPPSYLGSVSNSVYLFGAHHAASGFDSYIPTTTAAATRAADIIAPAVWDRPTVPMRLASAAALTHVPGYAEGLSLDFVEKVGTL